MPNIEVTIMKAGASWVAYAPRKGPYEGIGAAANELLEWMDTNDYPQAGPLGGAYYNSPLEVTEEALEWEVRCPVPHFWAEAFDDEHGVGIKQLPERELAVTVHRGPLDEINETYAALAQWVAQNGYRVCGPAEEVWLLDDPTGESLPVEVSFPVEKR